jgi:hypothetical protein
MTIFDLIQVQYKGLAGKPLPSESLLRCQCDVVPPLATDCAVGCSGDGQGGSICTGVLHHNRDSWQPHHARMLGLAGHAG